ncbi:uncharacterized protein LOC143585448 [Bidens hawaiensis]|uniref:uncharacterized protein LOC143585448 n=1 Tax=Bidens hawaiensis TaxID=980011 RepID=UPI004049F619
MGLLQSHEERINSRAQIDSETKKPEHQDEQALQVFNDQAKAIRGRGRGRGAMRGRAPGRGRGNTFDRSKVPQCHICKKYGHLKKDCWYNEEAQVNVAENDDQKMECALMALNDEANNKSHIWFIDSGCSNHMTGLKAIFTDLDETFKMGVQLGDKKRLNVEGRGTVKIQTGHNDHRLLEDVYFAPKLEYNLLSVAQLMKKGYSILFDDGKCLVKNKATGKNVMEISAASNNMFVFNTKCLIASEDMSSKYDSESRKWHNRYAHLKFESLKQLHDKEMLRKKLDKRSERAILIGYSNQIDGVYRLYNPDTKKFNVKRDVDFFEDARWNWKSQGTSSGSTYHFIDPFPLDPTNENQMKPTLYLKPHKMRPPTPMLTPIPMKPSHLQLYYLILVLHTYPLVLIHLTQPMTHHHQVNLILHHPPSIQSVPLKDLQSLQFGYKTTIQEKGCQIVIMNSQQFALSVTDPVTYSQDVSSPKWIEAMRQEIQAIEKNRTWQLVPLPPEKQTIGVKWLFKTKLGSNGDVVKHKARLVAKRYSQQPGIDYQETFAPAARFETIKLLISIVAQKGWKIHQLDVKSAFLNGEL